ncbi:type I pantothenate kinase [Candidatus Riesia pediculischaeffi]|uniref:Pantothenate kinase n=1 Tax=Candidatus Riesia pediculischaeffi PTSU TaxID=1401651 RepID=A0A0C1V6P5_9ENTR|nr:type I pantothenate kinase [Candidatus Riesia pediculischaeffi]KIE64114.1 Pantothenate kinase [Candidatus Riesia pediculischaeffi PTSU]
MKMFFNRSSYPDFTVPERSLRMVKKNGFSLVGRDMFWSFFKLYILHRFQRYISLNYFSRDYKIPYVIAITGSVAAGKSTTANLMKMLLKYWLKDRRIELVTTDSFLYPNIMLNKLGIIKKKGFPQSYNSHLFRKFLSDVKSGVNRLYVPMYSHIYYDIFPNRTQIVESPDLIILEGVNILQDVRECGYQKFFPFFDLVIYIDAKEDLLKNWYIRRFLRFCKQSVMYPGSHFRCFSGLKKSEIVKIANELWMEINTINLYENIFPVKEMANLVVVKGRDHEIVAISTR